jgi:hypothetical protein
MDLAILRSWGGDYERGCEYGMKQGWLLEKGRAKDGSLGNFPATSESTNTKK